MLITAGTPYLIVISHDGITPYTHTYGILPLTQSDQFLAPVTSQSVPALARLPHVTIRLLISNAYRSIHESHFRFMKDRRACGIRFVIVVQ